MHESLKIKKVISLLCFLFISLTLIKNNELGYAFLGYEYQMQNSSSVFSINNLIVIIFLISTVILSIKKNCYYLLTISPGIILITYLELGYKFYFVNTLLISLFILINFLFINLNLKNKIFPYFLILIINIFITSNFILIDKKLVTSEKINDIFNSSYRNIKSSAQPLIENICNNVKVNKYIRNKENNCSYNFEGTFSGNIPNKFNPIYNENGIFSGYTDIIFNYDRSSTRNIINNIFYLKSNTPIKKAILHKYECYIPAKDLIYSILNDQIECDDNTDVKKIDGNDALLGNVFINLKNDERYKYYGTYINGDEYKGAIYFPIGKNEKFQIITGPSSDNLYIELYSKNNTILYREKLKIYNSWTEVSINNLLNLDELAHIKLIDDGDRWGQWLGIRVIK